MPRTSKSKARNKKVHTEIEPAAPFQALLKPHETCDLLVPSKESPISLPTPLLLLYEFHWFLCHKGEEKGLSVYQAHTYFFFSPTLKLFFFLSRNPTQLKCLYLPLFFFYTIPNRKIFIHSLVSGRKETAKQHSALCWRWRDGRGLLWMNQEQKSCVETTLSTSSATCGFPRVTGSNPACHIHSFSLTAFSEARKVAA